MAEHKVLGLVSGGKDSCFNLLHCVANGHEVVALGTLTPESGTDELDSHLYQSVGTTVPPLIAQAMGIPHYSHVISGRAVEQGPEYGDRFKGGQGSGVEGDETEDLFQLLQDVMRDHQITAVSTGAILSTYQRLRIEHVCARLGLVSLAYLWQAEQLPLLEQMQACGMDVVLVKIAGVGLKREMVGKSLWAQLPALKRLDRIYGSHPAGEGGEYETITLDSPLFSHRVEPVDTEVIISDPEPNLVAYLRIPGAKLVPKPGWARPSRQELREILDLSMIEDEGSVLDEAGREVLEGIGRVEKRRWAAAASAPHSDKATSGDVQTRYTDDAKLYRRGRWFSISISQPQSPSPDSDIGSQMRQAFERIQAELGKTSLSLPIHAAHITLLLPSMALFPAANAAYTRFFGTSPPSRATVAVPLPQGVGVRVEVVGYDDAAAGPSSEVLETAAVHSGEGGLTRAPASKIGGRTALHVQSLSYWAPANIGPYSQAITVNSRVQIAGQISLIPSTLTLPPPPASSSSPYPLQCALALQHVRRVVEVLKSPNSTGGGWTGWVESVVAWWAVPSGIDCMEGEEDGEGEEVVRRAWQLWAEQNGCEETPFLLVRAKELPRGALVEFQVNLHTGWRSEEGQTSEDGESDPVVDGGGEDDDGEASWEDEGDEDDDELQAVYESGVYGKKGRWESCRTSGKKERGSRVVVLLDRLPEGQIHSIDPNLAAALKRAVSVRLYHLPTVSEYRARAAFQSIMSQVSSSSGGEAGITLIPVLDIRDRRGQEAEVALEVFGA